MIFNKIKDELDKGKPKIRVKGSMSEPGPVEIWGEVNIMSLNEYPISAERIIDGSIEFRGQIFASGALTSNSQHQPIYRIDNCHKEEGLHQHEGGLISGIEVKTIGEVLQTFFNKDLGEQGTWEQMN